jgi:hypothetical protein
MALSDKEQLMIMKQVALKAGVDFMKDRTNIPADVAEHLEETQKVATTFYEWLQQDTGISESDVPSVIEPEPNRTVIKDGVKKTFEPKCPNCDSKVWDNRQTATGKQPLWKCANKDSCDNGKGFPWASWNAEEFLNAELAFNKINKAELVDIDDLIEQADEDVAPF